MRIDTSDPKVTVLLHRPLFVPAFGLLFVVVGLFSLVEQVSSWTWRPNDAFGVCVALLLGGWLFLYTARRDDYRFDARTGKLSWVRRSLLGSEENSMPLTEIEAVWVHRGPECGSTTYRVVLETESHGMLPLTKGFSSNEGRHREVAEAIEAVLSGVKEPV